MKTRILSLLLAILMVVSCVPAMTLFAFAEEQVQEEYDYNKLYVGNSISDDSLYFSLDFFDSTKADYTKASDLANYIEVGTAGFSGGVTAITSPWKTTLGTNQWTYPQGGFGLSSGEFTRTACSEKYLIYKDAEAAASATVANPVIYDAEDEETFHTNALRSAFSVEYDFDNYNYYALDGGTVIYAVEKASAATDSLTDDKRYAYGFTTEYKMGTNGYMMTASSFNDGYFNVGLNTAIEISNVLSNVKTTSVNPSGDYTVELVYSAQKTSSGQALMADPYRINLGTSSASGYSFYFSATLTTVGSSKNPKSSFSSIDAREANTFAYTMDMISENATSGTTYAGTVNSDIYVNGGLYTGTAGVLNYDVVPNADGTMPHTVSSVDVSGSSSLFKIGEGQNINIYAVRVYKKALTQAELYQNHFADLMKFYRVDMKEYDLLSAEKKAEIHTLFRDFKLTNTKDEETANAVKELYFTAYLEAVKTGNEAYDAFMERVIVEGYSLGEDFSSLPKAKREAIIIALSAIEFTQSDIDNAVAAAAEKVNQTTEAQYNSLYVPDGALLLADFFSAKEGDYLTAGNNTGSNTYNGYYGRYKTDENGDYVLVDGKKVVEWIEASYTGAYAYNKYNGASSNYAPYVHTVNTFKSGTSTKTPYLSGGTLPMADDDILVSKVGNTTTTNIASNKYVASTTIGDYDYYLYEKADDNGELSVYTLRVPAGSNLASRNYEQYVVTTGAISDMHLQNNGNFAYTSAFHDGYFSNGAVSGIMLGELSTFVTTGAQASAASGGEEHVKYSIQVVFSNDMDRWKDGVSGGSIAMFGPPRTTIDNISSTNTNLQLRIGPNRGKIDEGFISTVYLGIDATAITDFTFAYDSTYTSFATADNKGVDTKGTMDMDVFVNGKLVDMRAATAGSTVVYYDDAVADQNKSLSVNLDQTNKTTDSNYKFGENGAANIYAIRYYGKTLTTAEIRQNHFVDVVKYNKVDVSNFFTLKESHKQEMYNLFANVLLDAKTTEELQAMYDAKYEELYWSDVMEEGNDSHNHVIDLARFYSLDLTMYNALPTTAKLELYKKTDAQDLDENIFDMDMQASFDAWIDEAIDTLVSGGEPTPTISALDLFVKEGLQYHVSFLKAKGTGEIFSKEVNGTTEYASKAVFEDYVLYNADGNSLYVVAQYKQSNVTVDKDGYSFGSPILKDGYLQLYTDLYDANDKPISGNKGKVYRGLTIANTDIINKPANVTIEYIVSSSASQEIGLWFTPYLRLTVKSTGVPSATISRWGRQGWSPFPFVYTTLGAKSGSLTYTQPTNFDITDAQTYTFVYKRDLTKTTYVYNPEDYNEIGDNASLNTNNKADYIDTYYTSKGVTDLPELTDEQKAALEAAGSVVKSGDTITAYLRNNTEMFRGAKLPITGEMEVKAYLNGTNYFTLASQPYTNKTGVIQLFTNYQQKTGNFYALRVYDRTISVEEAAQNHFADLAYKFDIELDIFALLSEEERQDVYEAMTAYHVSDDKVVVIGAYEELVDGLYYTSKDENPTENEIHFYEIAEYYKLNLTAFKKLARTIQLAICDEFEDVIISEDVDAKIIALRLQEAIFMQSDENFADAFVSSLVNFEGYAVRKSYFPGIRSIYTINEELLRTFESEDRGYTVTIGAMMGLANDGETTRTSDDLVMKKVDGEYVIDTARAAFVEVYNSASEKADENGFVASYWQEKDDVYHIAFTTVYEKETSQTVDMYNTELIYGAYVILEKEGEEDKIFYVDTSSEIFGGSVSLYEVSSTLKELRGDAYSMVQKVLNETDGTDFVYGKIAGVELPDFTFVYDKADEVFATELISELNAVIKEKLGVELKSSAKEDFEGEYAIYIVEREDLEDANYGVYVDGGNLYITYDYAANAKYAMDIARALFDCEGNIIVDADYNEMGSVPTYKVVMLGDSNTAQSYVYQAIDTYLQTQYGGVSVEILNAGTSGGNANGTLNTTFSSVNYGDRVTGVPSRLEREVISQNPDAIILCFGINDLQYSGVKTNKGKSQIDRIWDAKNDVEIPAASLFVDGEFIGIDKMKEQYPGAFTEEGRVNFKTVTYANVDEFNEAIKDTDYAAIVKFAVDSKLAEDMTDTNVTEFEKMMNAYRTIITKCREAGIEVIVATPVDYVEENTTTNSERCIGVKYTFELLVEYAKTVLDEIEGVGVIDYYTPQMEAKAAGVTLVSSDMKHFSFGATEARGPYILGNAFMSDMLKVANSGADTFVADFISDYASFVQYAADNTNGITFSYKPTGVSMAAVDAISATANYNNVLTSARSLISDKTNYNKEIIKVTGLDANATYSVKIGESTLAETYTGAQLAEGVDISLDANNPYAAKANAIATLVAKKRAIVSSLRDMSYVHENGLIYLLGGHLATDEGISRELVEEKIDYILAAEPVLGSNGKYYQYSGYIINCANVFMDRYDNYDDYLSQIDLYNYQIKQLLDFDALDVVITKIAD